MFIDQLITLGSFLFEIGTRMTEDYTPFGLRMQYYFES